MESEEDRKDPAPVSGEEGEHLSRKEWMGLIQYFVGGLLVGGFFLFMMIEGPKGVLAGGASLIVGILIWIVYRYVFREVD